MVLETEPQHAENTHFIVKIQIPESMQRLIPGQTIIGAVLQEHILRYLGINGIEIQIPPRQRMRGHGGYNFSNSRDFGSEGRRAIILRLRLPSIHLRRK